MNPQDQQASFQGGANQLTPQQEATLQEMERKAQDRIRVYNPTEEDTTVIWGGLGFVIPAKNKDLGHGRGQQILPRYIAKKYCIEMTTKILGQRLTKAVQDANQLRAERGQPKMNHWEERLNFEAPFRTDNPEARRAILPLLWLGIEEEFGMDVVSNNQTDRRDPRSIDEQMLASLDRPARKIEDTELPTVATQPDQAKVNEALLNVTPATPAVPIEPQAPVAPAAPVEPITAADIPNAALSNLMDELGAPPTEVNNGTG